MRWVLLAWSQKLCMHAGVGKKTVLLIMSIWVAQVLLGIDLALLDLVVPCTNSSLFLQVLDPCFSVEGTFSWLKFNHTVQVALNYYQKFLMCPHRSLLLGLKIPLQRSKYFISPSKSACLQFMGPKALNAKFIHENNTSSPQQLHILLFSSARYGYCVDSFAVNRLRNKLKCSLVPRKHFLWLPCACDMTMNLGM